jgi:2-succinyl-6-hydroxy-2,4-cyclohexadiene-1-carboxylate synthase
MIIRIHDVHYYVELQGEGEPLLLLHGFTGSTQIWQDFMKVCSTHYQMIAIDLIGHGQTESPFNSEHYQIQHQVEDLHQLTRALNLNKFMLLGYSMGGRIGLSFAMQYPDRVQALLLESSSPGISDPDEKHTRYQQDLALAKRIVDHGVESFVQYWESLPLFHTQQRLPAEIIRKQREIRLSHTKHGLANSLIGASVGCQTSWWNQLDNFEVPTLLITGELDQKFVALNHLMHQKLPMSTHIQISQSGHTPHLENPSEFHQVVMSYITNLLN